MATPQLTSRSRGVRGAHAREPRAQAASDALDFSLTRIGRYTNDAPFGLSDAEIVTHDPSWQRLYVGNARDVRVDILDIHDPANPTKVGFLDMRPYGLVVNSVAVKNGLVATSPALIGAVLDAVVRARVPP